MKISKDWLKELIDLKTSVEEVIKLLPLRTIGTKEVTADLIELDMKGYNRADLLSMRGVAYEVAAITDSQVKFIEKNEVDFIWENQTLPKVDVEVKNPDLVPVYCLAKIEGLTVGPSPHDWQNRLADCGMRSVNNLVDVTNLVMLEYGQPLHAFDAQTVKEQKIIVRTAFDQEKLVTLDNKERALNLEDLVIADEEKVLGLAGVMGGKNSEVEKNPTTILLEAAIFDPVTIRKTASRLNLSSEASKRFQHGLTAKRLLQALDAAIRMYQDLGGKLTALALIGDFSDATTSIDLNLDHLNSLIGLDLEPDFVITALEKLSFSVTEKSARKYQISPPYWRLDIKIEADLIEEVARMYGYEKIPARELSGETPEKIDQSQFDLIKNLKEKLTKLGLTETPTYSFYSSEVLNFPGFDKNSLVKIANPMSKETEYLRNQLWPNLLEAVAYNLKQQIDDLAIFEIGKVYFKKAGDPEEKYHLAIALSNNSDNPLDELYQIFQKLSSFWEGVRTVHLKGGQVEKYFHPIRFLSLEKDEVSVGLMAEVHPRIINKFGTDKRMALLEIEIEDLI